MHESGKHNGLCHLEVDVGIVNTVKTDLADVSCIGPSPEQSTGVMG